MVRGAIPVIFDFPLDSFGITIHAFYHSNSRVGIRMGWVRDRGCRRGR